MSSPLLNKPIVTNQLVILLVAGLLVVLTTHLGLMPLDPGDESRRALVALEMKLSGDYLTPTLNGERYFNKPPLYNWIILGSYALFGTYSSFALRFPMLVSLLLFGLTIYGFVRWYTSPTVAFLAALMTLTTGRVLLYDSLFGLIEITYSWVTYTAMLLVFHFEQRQKYTLMYLSSYALTAVGFMLKGLPSIAFEVLTLVGWLGYTRQWKRLLHPAHLAGVLLFAGLLGTYYAAYFSRNPIPLAEVAGVLFNESAKRTVAHFGIGPTVLHLFTFPVEVLYHFAPYLLLIALLFRPGTRVLIRQHAFIAFNALTFGLTVLVYWTSPQTYGRYLIGLMPLLLTVLAYLYANHSTPTEPTRFWVERIWLAATGILAVGCWATLFVPATQQLPGVVWKTACISVGLALLSVQMARQSANRLVWLMAVMLVIRLGFNWLVLPGRAAKRTLYKQQTEEAVRATLGSPLYAYRNTVVFDGGADLNTFHIEALRGDVLRRSSQKVPGAYYIADSANLVGEQYRVVRPITLFDRHSAYVIQFRDHDSTP